VESPFDFEDIVVVKPTDLDDGSGVSAPVLFQACATSRGMKAQVPGPPTVIASPILKVISQLKT
jgi:hypothetical protein